MLRLHNSLNGQKEDFRPRHPGQVDLYVCGITVYDYCHLGHARMLLVFDMVVRQLRAAGYAVNYVRNITDVDDKIIRRAAEHAEDIDALTGRFIAAMDEDCAALGLVRPDLEPRATVHMPQIIAMIEMLVAKGHAYATANGDVYYAVNSFPAYGRLSGKRLEELRIGARVAADEAKRDPLDFALWKSAKLGEPAWESPWGAGRPGWHIECSAMATHCLGAHFDIHGGGMDLKFPHHENEIAQSEGATGQHFVNYWLHNGFVQVGTEKMSKSLGNFRTIRDLLGRYRGEEIRFFILGTHYRSPLLYTGETMDAAVSGLRRLYGALDGVAPAGDLDGEAVERFDAAMNDDFNSAQAMSILFELARRLNSAKAGQPDEAPGLAKTLITLGGRLGLLQEEPTAVLRGNGDGADDAAIDALIEARGQARRSKDWAQADQIREELTQRGVVVEDKPDGSCVWRRS